MTSALAFYERLFGCRRLRVDHASLPSPLAYLRERGALTEKARGAWVSIKCPAHKSGDEEHPSMRVNIIEGNFRCMTCGARGGDILALHRLATGKGFADALRDLGGRCHD